MGGTAGSTVAAGTLCRWVSLLTQRIDWIYMLRKFLRKIVQKNTQNQAADAPMTLFFSRSLHEGRHRIACQVHHVVHTTVLMVHVHLVVAADGAAVLVHSPTAVQQAAVVYRIPAVSS